MPRVDFGRKAYLDLMVSKDPVIGRLIDEGYEFVTNAFEPGSKPPDMRVKDAQGIALELAQQGYVTQICAAYNEVGDPIPGMQSVWRKRKGALKE